MSATVRLPLRAARGVALAVAAALLGLPSAATAAETTRLLRLPAPSEGWRFEGERSERELVIALSSAERDAARSLELTVETAISALPGATRLEATINGRRLPAVAIDRPGRRRLVSVPIPPGHLVTGPNRLQLALAQRHRVDCSVAATYELWTRVDPAASGLAIASSEPEGTRGAGGVAGAGRTGAAVDEAGRSRLVAQVGRRPGEADLTRLFTDLQRRALAEGSAHSLVVVERGAAPAAGSPGAAAERPPEPQRGLVEADPPRRIRFSDAGMDSLVFAGRRLSRGFDLAMPADFMPAATGSVVVRLAGAYRGGLAEGASVSISVNGAAAAELQLDAAEGGILDGRELRLPLERFRPGRNRIAVEARLPSRADAACDTTAPADDRLVLLDSGTIDLPPLPRIARSPDLAATFAGGIGPATLHLPHPDDAGIAAAATLAVRLALEARRPVPLEVRFGLPRAGAGRAIVVGAMPDLPPGFAALFGLSGFTSQEARATPLLTGSLGSMPNVPSGLPGGATDPEALYQAWRQPSWIETVVRRLEGTVRSGFATAAAEAAPARPSAATTLVVAEIPGPDGASWTLVTARDAAGLAEGVEALAAPEAWRRVQGARVDYAAGPGTLVTTAAADFTYLPTRPYDLGNWRRVVAGWLSLRPATYAAILLGVILVLALAGARVLAAAGQKDGRP